VLGAARTCTRRAAAGWRRRAPGSVALLSPAHGLPHMCCVCERSHYRHRQSDISGRFAHAHACVFARCAHSRRPLESRVRSTTHSSAQPLRCTCPTQARSRPTKTTAAPRCYRVPSAHRRRSPEAPRVPLGPRERAAALLDQTHVWSACLGPVLH